MKKVTIKDITSGDHLTVDDGTPCVVFTGTNDRAASSVRSSVHSGAEAALRRLGVCGTKVTTVGDWHRLYPEHDAFVYAGRNNDHDWWISSLPRETQNDC